MNDLISRQAAIEALIELYEYQRDIDPTEAADLVRQGVYLAEKKIEELPSAHPGCDEWCTDCKEYDQQKHSCPRWNRVIRETVEELKSVQPGIIHCGDCRHWKNEHLCERLSKYGTFETEIYFYCGFAERREE